MPAASPIHRLDPRTRLLGALLLLAAVTAAPRLPGLALAFAGALVLTLLAHVPLGYALKGLLAPLPFILILVALQILLGPAGAPSVLWAWGPFHVSPTSLVNGARLLLRFPTLILLITTFSAATSTTEIVRGLEALLRPLMRIRLPVQDFVLMVQVALRFLPLLAQEAERIAKSQASRGAEWGTRRGGLLRRARQALPILVPLFLVSLQRAETLAAAMEARGYRSESPRTSLIVLRFRRADGLALVFCLVLAASILLI